MSYRSRARVVAVPRFTTASNFSAIHVSSGYDSRWIGFSPNNVGNSYATSLGVITSPVVTSTFKGVRIRPNSATRCARSPP